MSITIHQSYLTNNDCYKANKPLSVRGLTLHSVGCAQPSAMAFISTWNQPQVKKCTHGFIDGNTGEIYQTLSWKLSGWHAGGDANHTHIGVEMCEPATIRYTTGTDFEDLDPSSTKTVVERTYASAVLLFAHLCQKFSLHPMADGVILSHKEEHRRGIASNHGDPEHLWTNLGLTMDGFRRAVQSSMGMQSNAQENTGPSVPFLGKVTVDALHIRSGPGTYTSVLGTIRDHGVYTFVETASGSGASLWGKLKSGAGWVSLDYVTTI